MVSKDERTRPLKNVLRSLAYFEINNTPFGVTGIFTALQKLELLHKAIHS